MKTADVCREHGISEATFYIYGCLSRCRLSLELNCRRIPGCRHLSGVTGLRRAQMGIPRGEPQQMVGLNGHYKSQVPHTPECAGRFIFLVVLQSSSLLRRERGTLHSCVASPR